MFYFILLNNWFFSIVWIIGWICLNFFFESNFSFLLLFLWVGIKNGFNGVYIVYFWFLYKKVVNFL